MALNPIYYKLDKYIKDDEHFQANYNMATQLNDTEYLEFLNNMLHKYEPKIKIKIKLKQPEQLNPNLLVFSTHTKKPYILKDIYRYIRLHKLQNQEKITVDTKLSSIFSEISIDDITYFNIRDKIKWTA